MTSSAFSDDFKLADPHDVTQARSPRRNSTRRCSATSQRSPPGRPTPADGRHLIDITAPGGEEFTWKQLPGAIKALEDGRDIDYTGASGPIDMDVHGDPTARRVRRLPVQR